MQTFVADHMPALLPRLQRRARHLVFREGLTVTAEDLVQDVAVIALRIAARFDGDNLAGWLNAILNMRARDVGKRMRSRQRFEVEVLGTAEDDHGGAGERPDVPVEAHQPAELELRQVLEILAGMKPACREIIGLAVFDGLTYDEIAARLSIPSGTARSRLWRAHRELKARCDGTTTLKRTGRPRGAVDEIPPSVTRDHDAGANMDCRRAA